MRTLGFDSSFCVWCTINGNQSERETARSHRASARSIDGDRSPDGVRRVTVVTADEIKKYGYRTLADILQSAQGFYVSYDRNYAFLGARGINLGDFNSRVLLLINGHRVNNNLTDGAAIGTDFILDVDLIDRVEIIRGPGSVLYGNNAFFGVINVITRTAKQLHGAEVSGEYGSFDTYRGRFTYGNVFTNGAQLVFSGTYYDSAGPARLYYPEFDQRISSNPGATNNGVAEGLDDDRFGSFFGSVSYRVFELQGGYINREKGNPTAQFNTDFNDSRLRTTDERSYVNLKYRQSFPEIADVTAQVYYDRYDYAIGYPSLGVLYQEKDVGEWWGAELQLQKHLWEKHVVTLGAEYRDDFRQEININHGSRQSYGVYAGAEFALMKQLRFNGGLRYDQYGDYNPAVNPRLALIYNPFEKSTIKALYGTAFRAPNFQELVGSQYLPGIHLDPEEITTYELVYEQEITRWLRSSLSGYFNQMDRLIVFDNGTYTNFDAETKGVELALTGIWTNGIRGRASYSFQQTENRSTDQSPPDSPKHLVKFNLSLPLIKEKVFAGLEFLYTSGRHSVYTTSTGETLPGADAAGFGIVNVTLFSQNIIKNLEFSASVYNLLDRKYGDPATHFHLQDIIEQDGRTFRLKLTYRF
jgi:outer membrane receptor for ferrienterochelin and colicins